MIRRTIGALIVAAGLVAGLGACTGSEEPATQPRSSTSTPSLDEARQQVAAEASAKAAAELEAKARAKAGLCTPTANESEYSQRSSDVGAPDTSAGRQSIRDFIAWLEAAPEGCTAKDQHRLDSNLAFMRETLAKAEDAYGR